MRDSRTQFKAQRARVWGTTPLKFGTRACQCLARQPLFFAACKCKLCWAWVHKNLGVPGSCGKVALYPFLVVPCPMFLLLPINVAMFLSHMQMLLSPQLEGCLRYRAKYCQLRLFHYHQCNSQSDALMETFVEIYGRTSFWTPHQMDPLCCGRESDPEIPPEKRKEHKKLHTQWIYFRRTRRNDWFSDFNTAKVTISFPNSR